MPQDRRIVPHKYNPLLSSPASSAICTPFKPPPSVFLPSHCPLPSYLFHLTPDGALSWVAVGNLRSLVCERAGAASLPPAACWDFSSFQKIRDYSPKHFQVLCYRGGCRIGSLIWTLGKWPCGPLWLNLFHCFGSGLKRGLSWMDALRDLDLLKRVHVSRRDALDKMVPLQKRVIWACGGVCVFRWMLLLMECQWCVLIRVYVSSRNVGS